MNIKRHTNNILLTIFTLALTLASTPIKINAEIPAIKGLYTIFTPDVIGIGQALKTKGWIENVYDFAPNDNAAKELITALWHKVSEAEQLAPTKKGLVAEITPEVFGKILKYTKDPKTANQETKKEILETWIEAFLENEYKTKTDKLAKQITNKNNENTKLEAEKNSIHRIEKITTGSKEELEQNKNNINIRNNKIQTISTQIKANAKIIGETQKKVKESERYKITNLNALRIKLTPKLEPEIKNILDKIEKLAISQDFLPVTAEAILWAFFEDKFTTQDSRVALKNLLLCLKELDPKKLNPIKALEKYAPKEYEKFESEIKNLDDTAKINKIVSEYDRSTYSSITAANIKTVAPLVNSPSMQFQLSENIKIPELGFATCFESAILDTLSILLYDPKSKTYDTTLLPEDATKSKFFDTIIDNVFVKKVEKNGDSPTFIAPTDINTKFQDWINNIENKNKKDFTLEYHDHEQINGENIGYNLNTRIENLIKILNELFNLGIEIRYNQADPKILEIINFAKIIEKPTDAQDFWNKIFKFISKRISTDNAEQKSVKNRVVNFACELNKDSKPKFEITGDTIKISGSYGIICVAIKYDNYEYMQFNTEFKLHIESGHAYVKCPIRDKLGLKYSSDFKELLEKKIYAGNDQKLMPLFILLANPDMLENTDLKMQNILFYCMPLKTDENKLDFVKTIAQKGLFKDKNFDQQIKQFIDKILTNDQLTIELLKTVSQCKIKNTIQEKIIETAIKENPVTSFKILPKELIKEYISNKKIDINILNEKINKTPNNSIAFAELNNMLYVIPKISPSIAKKLIYAQHEITEYITKIKDLKDYPYKEEFINVLINNLKKSIHAPDIFKNILNSNLLDLNKIDITNLINKLPDYEINDGIETILKLSLDNKEKYINILLKNSSFKDESTIINLFGQNNEYKGSIKEIKDLFEKLNTIEDLEETVKFIESRNYATEIKNQIINNLIKKAKLGNSPIKSNIPIIFEYSDKEYIKEIINKIIESIKLLDSCEEALYKEQDIKTILESNKVEIDEKTNLMTTYINDLMYKATQITNKNNRINETTYYIKFLISILESKIVDKNTKTIINNLLINKINILSRDDKIEILNKLKIKDFNTLYIN